MVGDLWASEWRKIFTGPLRFGSDMSSQRDLKMHMKILVVLTYMLFLYHSWSLSEGYHMGLLGWDWNGMVQVGICCSLVGFPGWDWNGADCFGYIYDWVCLINSPHEKSSLGARFDHNDWWDKDIFWTYDKSCRSVHVLPYFGDHNWGLNDGFPKIATAVSNSYKNYYGAMVTWRKISNICVKGLEQMYLWHPMASELCFREQQGGLLVRQIEINELGGSRTRSAEGLKRSFATSYVDCLIDQTMVLWLICCKMCSGDNRCPGQPVTWPVWPGLMRKWPIDGPVRPSRRDGGAATWPGRHGMRASWPAAWLVRPAGVPAISMGQGVAAAGCGTGCLLLRPAWNTDEAHMWHSCGTLMAQG
ncbi:hypothetical protein E3N88_26650 [Mikania micrantha]|uniref:Uncharacterized protein n=1 Tax=Mikania micrantha TaxID=192012 RepID=A0A5N6MUE1_9ASTR|nr:hypothetical protein E3N88_26650 [Mikania micrantha]